MTAATAGSLAAYINSHSTNFSAHLQEYAGQVWVLVRDSDTTSSVRTRYIEPILDVPAYLARDDRTYPLLPEFRRLLEAWLSRS